MSLAKSLLVMLPLLVLALVLDALALRLTHGARLVDPYLILVVAFASQGGKVRALVTSGIAGFVQDLVASIVFGVHYLGKLVVGYGASLLVGRLIPGQLMTAAVLLGGGTIVEKAVTRAMGAVLGSDFSTGTLPQVLVEIAANVVLGVIVFRLADRFTRKRGPGGARAR